MALPQDVIRLEAGEYVFGDPFPVRVSVEVPEGWTSCVYGPVEAGVCRGDESGVGFVIVDNVVSDPCDPSRPPLVPPVGPSVDDLVNAISNLDGFESTDPVDLTVDGFQGKQLELSPEPAFCQGDISTWATAERTNGIAPGRSEPASHPRRGRDAGPGRRCVPTREDDGG